MRRIANTAQIETWRIFDSRLQVQILRCGMRSDVLLNHRASKRELTALYAMLQAIFMESVHASLSLSTTSLKS